MNPTETVAGVSRFRFDDFDNMSDLVGGSGYTVLDCTEIAQKNINHETDWGVTSSLYRGGSGAR